MSLYRNIYLSARFFYALGAIIVLFALSFAYPALFTVSKYLLGVLFTITIMDAIFCYIEEKKIAISRTISDRLSLGDRQAVQYEMNYTGEQKLHYELYDEYPDQLQYRSALSSGLVKNGDAQIINHQIRPTARGIYFFNHIHVFIKSLIGLIEWRKSFNANRSIHVFPSIIQMKKYQLEVFNKTAHFTGIRKVRQIGENDEFEHIRNYAPGDNIKSINWKATARNNEVMVNQFQNTRSQSVYILLDKGRAMKMPFDGMTLLDYAINSSLVLSNIVLKKYDKAGLISFSHEIDSMVPAHNRDHQLERVIQTLYAQKTSYLEPNFPLLFTTIRRVIKRRSILILFTNFEQELDMQRALPYLTNINRTHILVVILFRNTELEKLTETKPSTKKEIYLKTMGQRLTMNKEQIAQQLKARGINTILTRPENLSTETINAYLKIKARHAK